MALQARGVGEEVDLLRVIGAREEEELLAAGVLEGGESLLTASASLAAPETMKLAMSSPSQA
jgi:hypothetical protein